MNYFTTKSLIIKIKDKHTSWLDKYVTPFKWELNLEDVGEKINDIPSIVKDTHMIEIEIGDLEVVMDWCIKHPKMCQKLAENGFELLNNIVEDKVLLKDMAYTIEKIANQTDMSADAKLSYDMLEKTHSSFKTMKIHYIQNNQLEYFKRNVHAIEYETNTKIDFIGDTGNGYFEGQENIAINNHGFDYSIDQAIDIIEKHFTNVYEQILDLPLRIQTNRANIGANDEYKITGGSDSSNDLINSVFIPDFIKKYKANLESYFNISIEQLSQTTEYNEWSMRGINSRGDVFSGKYTVRVFGSEMNVN